MRSIRTFKTFLAVVKHGSFAAAGHVIGLTPAAIGLQMRSFEEELNQQVFDRAARSVELNPAGRKLVPAIEDLVQRYEAITTGRDTDELSGTVVMGALISALMGSFADALWSIKKQYPRLEVRLLAGQSADFTRKVALGEPDLDPVVSRNHGVDRAD
jgi:DNA-binding transcriptional LysR family regulator